MSAPHFKDHEAHLRAIIDAALRAVDPFEAVLRAIDRDPPDVSRPCFAVGAGKASVEMTGALYARLGSMIEAGVVAARPEHVREGAAPPFAIFPADHPLPTERNLIAAEAIRAMAMRAGASGPDATLFVMLSGGGSAHLTLPIPPLELWDVREVTGALLRAGAPIRDLNAVRKHCEQLKGGRLAVIASPARVLVFVLSDVEDDRLDTIASGPCAPDRNSFTDALALLGLHCAMGASPGVTRFLEAGERGEHAETPKPGDPVFNSVAHCVIANNRVAVEAATAAARDMGFSTRPSTAFLTGDARELAYILAAGARLRESGQPDAIIFGGETTVNVGASRGKGGRNQELALAAAIEIDGVPNIAVATFATDGVDGPTDAAGAIVTGDTCARARGIGLDPGDFLARHDSYTFFEKAGGHIKTGPTGTNVNDLAIALVY